MVCEVWWARVGDVAPGHDALLSEEELARRARFARDGDQARFTAGVAVTRLVLGELLDTSPGSLRFDRTCVRCGGAHGKPSLPGRPDLQWSVSHAGHWVLVAVHRGPALGVDIEQVRELPGDELGQLADYALARSERHRLQIYPPAQQSSAFTTYWARKEAVLKVSGEGITAPSEVVVSAPHRPPRVLRRRHPDGPVALLALPAPADHAAVLAVASFRRPSVVHRDARRLLETGATVARRVLA